MITTVLNTKISEVDNKLLDTSILVIITVLNTKLSENKRIKVENKMNKIPDHTKYITSQEFNKLTAENFAA